MKKTFVLFILFFILFSSCQQIKQMATFTKCQFRMSTVENTNLAGVNVQQIQSVSDLNLLQAGKITASYAAGSLPLTMTVNVDVQNPNTTTAALNQLEWILMIEDKQILDGVLNDKVTIAPDGIVTMPIKISADLKKILAGKSAQESMALGLGLTGAGNKPSKKLSLKVKPSIMIGSLNVKYPGYITVGTNFGTGSN